MKHARAELVTAFGIVVSVCLISFSVTALNFSEFRKIIKTIEEDVPEEISFKAPVFTKTQINELGESLSESQNYLVQLNLIKLSKLSEHTEDLFKWMKKNNSILVLNLTGSYLSDDAMTALVDLLARNDVLHNQDNQSVLEEVVLDDVIASHDAWLGFAERIGSFDLYHLSLQGLVQAPCSEETSIGENPCNCAIDDLVGKMRLSLCSSKRLTIDLSKNRLVNPSLVANLKKNTPWLVKVIYRDEQPCPPQETPRWYLMEVANRAVMYFIQESL